MCERAKLGQQLLSVFDRIYVINLEDRPDRRADMACQLARLGLSFDHPAVRLFSVSRPSQSGEFPTRGTKGCFESHMSVLRDFVESGAERCLILEDDADLTDRFEAFLPDTVKALKTRPWDLFFAYPPEGFSPTRSHFAQLPPDRATLCLHCYGITHEAAALALPYLRDIYLRPAGHPEGGAMHVDGAYNWFRRQHSELVTLVSMRSLAHQRASRSDIHPLAWYDRWPIVKDAVASLRRFKPVG